MPPSRYCPMGGVYAYRKSISMFIYKQKVKVISGFYIGQQGFIFHWHFPFSKIFYKVKLDDGELISVPEHELEAIV